MEDNEEEENVDNYHDMFPEYGTGNGMEDNDEEEAEDRAPDEPIDDLGQAITDAKAECEIEKVRVTFDQMLKDHKTLLYPNCEDGQKKLGSTLELLQWKAENGVTDSGFTKLLQIMKKQLPRKNELPDNTYQAKKVVCPLGLDVEKIHACINDCILYRGEQYENLEACPVCTALRYKIRRDDPGDVEGERPRKRVPAKVMWYAPIIPRLKRLFRNKEHAKLLRWHMEDRKKDEMLRHPADGSQWRKIEREYPDFADDARNLRFGLREVEGRPESDTPVPGAAHKKRDTRAILLKIALVRISCIQNTQIRGKTIAKVFGKVDTFWTYQLPPSLAIACPQAIQ